MTLASLILYFTFLTVVAGFAVLWSGWPEKHGGWVLATKQKLPPMLRLWHAKHLIPFYILAGVLLLLSAYLEYNAVKGLSR